MDSTYFIGYLVVGLVALIGLFVAMNNAFTKPVNDLSTNLVKTNMSMERLNEKLEDMSKRMSSDILAVKETGSIERKRIWDDQTKQDKIIEKHESRINNLEHTKKPSD